MRTKDLSSTALALHRVFIAPHLELKSRYSSLLRPLSSISPSSCQRRTYASGLVAGTRPEKARLPRNDEIKAWSIVLSTPSGLTAPRQTRDVLASLDPKTHILEMVAEGSRGVPPVCKIIDRSELYAAQKRRKEAQKRGKDPAKTVKELELNWAIDQKGDLVHRLEKLRGWLEKGWRVEVLLVKKRKGKVATEEECDEVLKKVKGLVKEAEGRFLQPDEGSIGGVYKVYCQGKKKEVD